MSGSTRPPWLGPDVGRWDHVRLHVDLFTDPRIGPYEFAVLGALAKHADVRTGECHPAIKTVARYFNMNERTVRRSIDRLEELDYLRVNRTNGKVNLYYLMTQSTADSESAVTETADSGTEDPGLKVRGTADSGTYEQEPITRTKNKQNRTLSYPQNTKPARPDFDQARATLGLPLKRP